MTDHPSNLRTRPMRERAALINRNLRGRLDAILPLAMRETGFDMWIILCQEDNPDPVFTTLIPMDTWCPILQILVFYDRGAARRRAHQHLGHEHARPVRPALRGPARTRAVAAAAQNRRGARPEAHRHQHRRDPMGGRRADPQPVQPARRQSARALRRAAGVGRAAGHPLAGDADRRGDRHLRARRAAGPRHHRRMLQPRGDHAGRDDHDRSGMVLLAALRRSGRWISRSSRSSTLRRSDALKAAVRPGRSGHPARRPDPLRRGHPLSAAELRSPGVGLRAAATGETDAPAGLQRADGRGQSAAGHLHGRVSPRADGQRVVAAHPGAGPARGVPDPRVYSHSLGLFLHEPGPLIGLPWEQEVASGAGRRGARLRQRVHHGALGVRAGGGMGRPGGAPVAGRGCGLHAGRLPADGRPPDGVSPDRRRELSDARAPCAF